MGIGVSMTIATVFVFAMEQFTIMVEKNAAEESILNISYYMKDYLAQAVDIEAVSVINTAAASVATGTGQINVKFDLLNPLLTTDITAPDSGQFARFAFFNREAGTYNVQTEEMPAGGSDLRPTAIFIKDTDVNGLNADAQSGMVVFDYNSNTGAMAPNLSDLWFSRVHNVRVQRVNCNGFAGGFAAEVVINMPVATDVNNGRVMSCLPANWPAGMPAGATFKIKTLTLEVMVRYFKTSSRDTWNFRAPIGGAAVSSYRDIVRTLKINFKNNLLTNRSLTSSSGTEERVHGGLYFFDYIVPNMSGF